MVLCYFNFLSLTSTDIADNLGDKCNEQKMEKKDTKYLRNTMVSYPFSFLFPFPSLPFFFLHFLYYFPFFVVSEIKLCDSHMQSKSSTPELHIPSPYTYHIFHTVRPF